MTTIRLSKSVVDAANATGRDDFVWDSEVTGFGLKVTSAGKRVYICQYRLGGGRRGSVKRYTIGVHGSPWTVDAARAEARRILALAATGGDPAADKQEARRAPTVGELCDLYLKEGCATKKASTLATDRGRIERHIKPLLGRRKAADVTRADVRRFLQDVANGETAADVKTKRHGRAIVTGGRGTATRTVGLLGGIFSYAVEREIMSANPVRGVKRFPDRKSERFLSQAELASLGEAMRTVSEGVNPSALAIIKLLVFTGARKSEIEQLRWGEVDLASGLLRLEDSKTGQKGIILNPPAIAIFSALSRTGDSSYVFPAERGDGHFEGTVKVWRRIRELAGLADVRLHDLRHSFASVGVASGASLPVIGALLGHGSASTTARYVHLSNDPLRLANDAIGKRLASALEPAAVETVRAARQVNRPSRTGHDRRSAQQ